MLMRLGGMRHITMPNFFQNWSIQGRDIAIFQFFKVADGAILNFQICEMLLADSVCKAQTHHHGKCRAIFGFSKWSHLLSWIFEIAKFYWLTGSGGLRCISIPNIVKMCQPTAKILQEALLWQTDRATRL